MLIQPGPPIPAAPGAGGGGAQPFPTGPSAPPPQTQPRGERGPVLTLRHFQLLNPRPPQLGRGPRAAPPGDPAWGPPQGSVPHRGGTDPALQGLLEPQSLGRALGGWESCQHRTPPPLLPQLHPWVSASVLLPGYLPEKK